MDQKNIKLALGLVYLVIIFFILYIILSKFNYEDFTSYKFIQSNSEKLISFKEQNIFFTSFLLIIFSVLWVIFLGFGTPIALAGGFIFGKWLGTFLVVFSLTFGSSILYIISLFFFKNLINEIFSKKFSYLEKKFKKQELAIMIIFRIVGIVPFAIQNILPALFNIKLRNYFFGTLIGITPSIFIMTSLGSGLENVISTNNEIPTVMDAITKREIYLPIIGFAALVITTFFFKSKLNKN